MRRWMWLLGMVVAAGVATAIAQPPGRPGGDERGGQPGGPGGQRGDFPPPPNPLFQALDTDGDGEISASEIANAAKSLLTLDKNKDGKLSDEETRPPRPEDGGDRPAGRKPIGAPVGGQAGKPGRRPDGIGGGGSEGRGPERRGAEGQGAERRGPEDRGGPDGPPPPNPERFVEHAMEFDADQDGKLDRSELAKFAQDLARRRGGPGGPGAGRGGPGVPPKNSERPERSRRPE